MEGRPVAVNLMMSTRLLGTFDKPSEAVQEVDNIYNDKSECYAIGGFSNYDGAADLMDTLKETEGALSEMD
jgi:hypothetical protein